MKYSWMGQKHRNIHKNRMKRSGRPRLVNVRDVKRSSPTTWRWARENEEKDRRRRRRQQQQQMSTTKTTTKNKAKTKKVNKNTNNTHKPQQSHRNIFERIIKTSTKNVIKCALSRKQSPVKCTASADVDSVNQWNKLTKTEQRAGYLQSSCPREDVCVGHKNADDQTN